MSKSADAIYVNGKVITVDREFSSAEAFAVGGEKFIAVGKNADIRKLAGPQTRVVDLSGRTVFPGFIDAHPHTVHRGLEAMLQPSLFGLRSVAQIVQAIGKAAAQAAPGTWIATTPIGDPPDYFHLPESFPEKRWPTRADLDKVAPNNPVHIPTPAYWPHPAIFNSAALSLLGVTRDTPDSRGITIVKDPATGEPNGQIYGVIFYNAGSPLFGKLMSLLPQMAPQLQWEGIRRALKENVAVGVTTLYEGHGNFNVPQLQTLKAAGEALGRVICAYEIPVWQPIPEIDAWMTRLTDAAGTGTGDDYFKIAGVTVSLDGPSQFGLAWMREPYLNPFGQMTNGSSAASAEKLADIARLAVKHNFRLNVVAAGEKACELTVEALETVNRESPLKGRRWIVQHFQHPSREGIAKLQAMGMVAQTYASADYSKGAETYIKRFPGSDIWKRVVPMRWWLDGGVPTAGSSDGGHYDPMFQIWETIVRIDGRTGQSLLTPEKTVTRAESIQIHTINGAYLLQWEDRIGSIEAGKFADFVVLDRDLLTVPVDQIRDAKVLLTAVGGKVLHDPDSLAGKRVIN